MGGKTYERCKRCGHYFVIFRYQVANTSDRNTRRYEHESYVSLRKDICNSCADVEETLRWYKGNGEWDYPNKVRVSPETESLFLGWRMASQNRSRYESSSVFPIEIDDIEKLGDGN